MSTGEVIHPLRTSGSVWQIPPIEPKNASPIEKNRWGPTNEKLTALARDGGNEAFGQLIKRDWSMCMRRPLLRREL